MARLGGLIFLIPRRWCLICSHDFSYRPSRANHMGTYTDQTSQKPFAPLAYFVSVIVTV